MTILFALLAILFAWLSWNNVKLSAKVLVGLLPIYLLRVSLLRVPSTMLEIFIWILILSWIIKGLLEHRWKFGAFRTSVAERVATYPIRLPVTLLLLAGFVATLVAPDLQAAFGIYKAYAIEPLLVLVLLATLFERKDLPDLFMALGITSIALSLVAIFQYTTGLGIPEPWDTARRVTSIFAYPNALGLFLAPIVSAGIVLSLRYKNKKNWRKLGFWIVVVLLGLVSMILSQTEAAFVSIPAALILLGLFIPSARKGTIALTIFAVLLLALSPWRGVIMQKLTLQDASGQVRLSQWSETWDYLSDGHWVFGAGLSGYPTALVPYHSAEQYEIFQYPHNIFLNVWVELGIIGLILLLWFAYEIARLAYKNKNDVLSLAAFAALLQMCIHGLVDVPFFKNDLAVLVWVFVAVILIVNRYPNTPKPRPTKDFE